jgi:hypothetical protein
MSVELLIQNGSNVFQPEIQDGLRWTTERKSPSILRFSVVNDKKANFTEGNPVRLRVGGQNVFYGFVFTKRRDKQDIIDVTAYDQTRYLKNKDTFVYSNKTASDVIRMIASEFRLNLGTIENTGFIIPSRVEDNQTMFDVIYNALDLTLTNRGEMYVLYDDFGRLSLKALERMKVPILIDEETGENFDYSSSIDNDTYNRIKLSRENEETGRRDVYIAQDGANMNAWGVLQLFDTLQEGENGKIKADALLSLYNNKTRKLQITRAMGDVRVRGGSMPVINLNLGDMSLRNHLLVEKAVHTFNESEHWMNLTMRGGEFVG